MLRSDFDFDLPEELIAQVPLDQRNASRLLCLTADDELPRDCQFSRFHELLNPGDLLVMNDTRVIPARLYGRKQTGGHVEILLERLLDSCRCLAQVRPGKSSGPGVVVLLDRGYRVRVVARQDDLFEIETMDGNDLLGMLDEIGHMPLPPYIKRADTDADQHRYQTVYANRPGAVAAPTAGLHFDATMLRCVQDRGVKMACVTLHVGAGTFQPVRTDHIEDHKLHKEWIEISQQVVDQIHDTKAAGGRVVAVGTTSVRVLESAARTGQLRALSGDTDIFIYPGYVFRVVDALLTNFHLPESSLLMLVAAFGGYDRVLAAYRYAVRQHYRFFSYGDAMFIEPGK